MIFSLCLIVWLMVLHIFTSPKRFNILRDDIELIICTILRSGWWPITIIWFIATIPWTAPALMLLIFAGIHVFWDTFQTAINILLILLGILPITALYRILLHLIRKPYNEIDDIIEFNITHSLIFFIGLVTLSLIAFGFSFILEIPISIDLSKNILIWWLYILGMSIIVFFYRNYHIFKQYMITCWIYIWIIFFYWIWLYIHIAWIYNMADFPCHFFSIFMIYSEDSVFGATLQAIALGIYLMIINNVYLQRFHQKNPENGTLSIIGQPIDTSDEEVVNSLIGKNTYKISNRIIYGLTVLSLFTIPMYYIWSWYLPKALVTILFCSQSFIPILFSLSFWKFSQSLNKTHGDIFMYSSTILVIILFSWIWLTPAEAWWLQHILVAILTPTMILMSIWRIISWIQNQWIQRILFYIFRWLMFILTIIVVWFFYQNLNF